MSRVLQKTPEMHEGGSVASLTLAFFIIQYFLINKGISVASDIKKKKMSCLFNNFGLKCLLSSTDMHEIDYTFLFLSFFFSFFFFFPKVIWRRWGEGGNAFH